MEQPKISIPPHLITISSEVKSALSENLPIVALESTIITHGMEYPINLSTASSVEETIRKNGAIPATITIIKGKIHVGLSKEELEEISKNKKDFIKCSTRDIPYALMEKKNGSTTVAATMYIANAVGIKVFVTGGIGGVHYGNSLDISGDLIELSRTPVTVVCAGAKSILDIPRTLEFLETYNVPVVGFNCDKFPEFFFANGDCNVKIRLNCEKDVAQLIKVTHSDLNMKCGILVAVPVPEDNQCDKNSIKTAIKEALKECDDKKIIGNEITPFLLKRVNELTKGESCDTNVKLILNNAKVGAQICKELFQLMKEGKEI
jgi:pseudouridine-5'-phosphate glycosidase